MFAQRHAFKKVFEDFFPKAYGKKIPINHFQALPVARPSRRAAGRVARPPSRGQGAMEGRAEYCSIPTQDRDQWKAML